MARLAHLAWASWNESTHGGQHLPDRFCRLVNDLIKLVRRRIIGWGQNNAVAGEAVNVSAHRVANESIFKGLLANAHVKLQFGRKWRFGLAVFDQFDCLE